MKSLQPLDIVANIAPIPTERLTLLDESCASIQIFPAGQVGTILEVYGGETLNYLVEFSDSQGREYAMAILRKSEVLALKYDLVLAA